MESNYVCDACEKDKNDLSQQHTAMGMHKSLCLKHTYT